PDLPGFLFGLYRVQKPPARAQSLLVGRCLHTPRRRAAWRPPAVGDPASRTGLPAGRAYRQLLLSALVLHEILRPVLAGFRPPRSRAAGAVLPDPAERLDRQRRGLRRHLLLRGPVLLRPPAPRRAGPVQA